jgi:hypothetical protein
MKIGTLALATFMAFTSGTAALAQSDFYRGKQLKIVVGSEAGGAQLLFAAAVGLSRQEHSGNPAVSIQHLPGPAASTPSTISPMPRRKTAR